MTHKIPQDNLHTNRFSLSHSDSRAGTGNIIFEVIGKAGNGRVPDIGSRRSLTQSNSEILSQNYDLYYIGAQL